LLVEAEFKSLSVESNPRPHADEHPELVRIKAIYEDRRTNLLRDANTKREKILEEYQMECIALQKALTKRERIKDALEARDLVTSLGAEIESIRLARAKSSDGTQSPPNGKPPVLEWETPFEGILVEPSSEAFAFVGSNTVGEMSAVVARNEFPATYVVKGEIKVTGQYPGIVLGYVSKNRLFAIACSVGDGTEVETWERGDRVKTTRHELRWSRGIWEPLEIARNEKGWTLRIGGTKQLVPLPQTARGRRFGFMTFGPGKLELRSLIIAIE